MKTNLEYLTERAEWPHILKMRAAVLGQLAINEALRSGKSLIQAEDLEVEVEVELTDKENI